MSVAGRFTCLALALALAACDGEGGGATDDAVAAGSVAETLESGGELTRLILPLQASAELVGQAPAAALALQLLRAQEAFTRQNPACVTATIGAASLDVRFDGCRVPPLPLPALFTADGSLHAELSIEAPGGVASRMVVAVTIPGIEVTGLRTRRLSGAFELRQAISATGAPLELEGELGLVRADGAELALYLGAELEPAAAGCVIFTGGAKVSGEPLGPLGPIALSGDAVHRCRNECPTSGSVELSYGMGKLLAWTYTGGDTALVTGPRGKRLEVLLPCAGD